jgi:hypothetical protein
MIDVDDIRPVSVAFTDNELVVTLADDRKVATPLAWYPRLRDAGSAARPVRVDADGYSLA